MLRLFRVIAVALAIGGAVNGASAFSLLGPLDAAYQTTALGYNPGGGDIGGPMNLGEEYRWNVKTITYGFDPSFMNYFGVQGSNAIVQAINILNHLPPMSKLKLDDFPTDTIRVNYRASALNLVDLKSEALAVLVEEMGLTSPERYVWTLRNVVTISGVTYYTVIRRNFDPVTLTPSSYVNNILYTYAIVDPITVSGGGTFADAVELTVDPLEYGFTAVVSESDGLWGIPLVSYGSYFSGLTRDDVGGLRYIYRKNNYNVETLPPGVTNVVGGLGGGSAWAPVGGSTNVISTALRPGIERIIFKYYQSDSVFGGFPAITNAYTDSYVTNSHAINQRLQRIMTQPDIVFSAADLGVNAGGIPVLGLRTTCAAPSWVNNSALNTTAGGFGTTAGPGQIQQPIFITFNKVGPFIQNATPNFLDEANPNTVGWVWGSFDGTTNDPIVYPSGTSVQDLEQQVLGGH